MSHMEEGASLGRTAAERPEVTTIAEHDKRSDERCHYLGRKLDKLAALENEEVKMEVIGQDNTAALIAAMMGGRGHDGTGAGLGAGLGGGLLGGILGGALLGGNNGLLGRNGAAVAAVGEGCVTPSQFTAGLAGVTDSQQNTAVLQTLGAIQGAIPVAEGQVQLAIAGAVGEIRSHLGQVENGLTTGQAAINQNISQAIASSLASQNNINVNVLQSAAATRDAVTSYGVANLTATKDAQFATSVAISASTKEILAALNQQNVDNLQRQLTVAESRAQEDRLFGRQREVEVNVTQTVNQVQAQAQAQQQQQQQLLLLNNLCNLMGGLQNAVATNSNMIIGNTGAVGTGPQTANPVNVNARA